LITFAVKFTNRAVFIGIGKNEFRTSAKTLGHHLRSEREGMGIYSIKGMTSDKDTEYSHGKSVGITFCCWFPAKKNLRRPEKTGSLKPQALPGNGNIVTVDDSNAKISFPVDTI
jgi:hypothetical protein